MNLVKRIEETWNGGYVLGQKEDYLVNNVIDKICAVPGTSYKIFKHNWEVNPISNLLLTMASAGSGFNLVYWLNDISSKGETSPANIALTVTSALTLGACIYTLKRSSHEKDQEVMGKN